MSKAVERFWGHYEINEETLAVELTVQIMRGTTTNFMDTDHTAAHYKAEQWYPRWLERVPWQGTEYEVEAERRMMQRIDQYCKDAIRRYERPNIEPAKAAELKRIYQVAEKRILGKEATCA